MEKEKYLAWVDMLKAICMIGVYLCHSEGLYGKGEFVGYMVKPFYVNAFFFVSGYLLFRKYLNDNRIVCRGGYLPALKKMVFRLVIPTILFSTIIYVPKVVYHGRGLHVTDYLVDVFGGISYWFTSALVVAQLLLLTLVFLTKRKEMWFYLLVSTIFFVVGFVLNTLRTSDEIRGFLPWFYQTGLEYTLLMAAGGIYCQNEQTVDKWVRHFWLILLLVFVAILAWAAWEEYKLQMLVFFGQINAMGAAATCCGIVLVVALCKRIRPIVYLSWIGRNSIVFYFFSGVFPAMVSAAMLRFFPVQTYPLVLLITLVSIILGAMTTYAVNRFAPFLIDLRKICGK